MKVIINGDDFGRSGETNLGIYTAMKEGLISSTTVLPNMPGFEEAIELSKTKEFRNKVGVHLNLFEGRPLTSDMMKCRVFTDDSGNFHKGPIKFYSPLKLDRKIIYREIEAQIDRVISSGLIPTHIDSHAHRHTNFFIGSDIIKLAKHFGISAIRISPNMRNLGDFVSNIMPKIYNLRLKVRGIVCVDYLGSISDAERMLKYLNGTLEIITHPVSKSGILEDSELPGLLEELLSPFSQYDLIPYSQLERYPR